MESRKKKEMGRKSREWERSGKGEEGRMDREVRASGDIDSHADASWLYLGRMSRRRTTSGEFQMETGMDSMMPPTMR